MTMQEPFLRPQLDWEQIESYHIRTAILNALKSALPEIEGVVLDIGCGSQPYKSVILGASGKVKSYIGIDLIVSHYPSPNVGWDGVHLPLTSDSVNCAILTEVLEHCPEPVDLLSEVNRVMTPGGLLFLTVPFLWHLHDIPFDEYRYTPFALRRMLSKAGFTQIDLTAHGGCDASLAQMIALWAKLRPMAGCNRLLVSRVALPVVNYLLRKDRVYGFWGMITGISGQARKPQV